MYFLNTRKRACACAHSTWLSKSSEVGSHKVCPSLCALVHLQVTLQKSQLPISTGLKEITINPLFTGGLRRLKYGKPPQRRPKRSESSVQDDAGKPGFSHHVCACGFTAASVHSWIKSPETRCRWNLRISGCTYPLYPPGLHKKQLPCTSLCSPFTLGRDGRKLMTLWWLLVLFQPLPCLGEVRVTHY